jgi:hypothetical protein
MFDAAIPPVAFADTAGRRWRIDWNNRVEADIRRRLKIAIVRPPQEGERTIFAIRDAATLTEVLFLLVAGQAETAGIDFGTFRQCIDEHALASGRDALFASLAHFLDAPIILETYRKIKACEHRLKEGGRA